ncbi:basic-leucine zipper transcription factor A [Zeugodacus cucurbitae]|uniref:basic-leucine zipper transcription factor A n=1 Tax=Zeugodacus cucurbitae TaxID=28588 RepID=UPI000596ACC5|nr:basic-leucine zipper transcription factor A [Zeugodacus cucurbitae]
MFYSLVQTIVCVLLIQAGIYGLHLNGPGGNSNGASLGSGGGGGGVMNAPSSLGGSGAAQLNTAVNTNQMLNILSANQHAQHLHAGGSGSGSGGGGGGGLSRALSKSAVSPLSNAERLSQEVADRAQLERERLMLLGLAKQTTLANSGTGHHGRPIITGRIQMSPVDEVDNDYSSLLLPQSRGPLYGSVVKEPAVVEDDEYVDEEREYDRARLNSGGHRKYEYGRIVEPAEHEEYAEPQHMDELDELIEAEPELDDVISDLESYQYLDELLPPEHRSLWGDDGAGYAIAGGNSRPHHLNDGFPLLLNPYRTLEELENSPSHTLQEIFEKESHDKADVKPHRVHTSHPTHEQQKQQQQQQQPYEQQYRQPTQPQQQYSFSGGVKHRNGGYPVDYNNNMQQKWQRKRSQQQQQQRQLQQWQRNIFGQQLKQQQLHHFGAQPQRHSKLSLANSEATATKHIPLNGSVNNLNNNNNSNNKLSSTLNALATQQQSSSAPAMSSGDAAMKSELMQQQQQQQEEPTQQQVGKDNTADVASPPSGLSKAAAKLKAQQQQQQHKKQQTPSQKQESFLHPNHKRSGSIGGGVGATNGMSAAAAAAATNGYSSIASQLMLRTARGQRQYDVPQIECPTAMDGMERFACPTPDVQGRYRCIDDHVLCDGFIDCPEGEDEDRRSCMFYKTVKAHLDVLADALLRWARGR